MRGPVPFRWLALVLALLLPLPAAAQDSLADIKADLAQLKTMMAQLKQELSTTGASGTGQIAGSALDRMNAMESELERLTGKTEQLEQRINKVVADGTNRIGDLDFRITELEGGDISKLGDTPPLGGEAPDSAPVVAPPSSGSGDSGAELAVSEKGDFDRAKEALDSSSFRSAADQFATFVETYPGSPLTSEAYYYRGEALMSLGETANAARAWLAGFTAAPQGTRAADSLLKLGLALNALGQPQEACVTLGEVPTRFPGSSAASEAERSRAEFGCN